MKRFLRFARVITPKQKNLWGFHLAAKYNPPFLRSEKNILFARETLTEVLTVVDAGVLPRWSLFFVHSVASSHPGVCACCGRAPHSTRHPPPPGVCKKKPGGQLLILWLVWDECDANVVGALALAIPSLAAPNVSGTSPFIQVQAIDPCS